MRFGRWQHLRTGREFAAVRAEGCRGEGGAFFVQVRLPTVIPAGRTLPLRRLGVVAPRRIGNAVARNRAKRLIRESFRLRQEALPAACDIVVVLRRGAAERSARDIADRFARATAYAVRKATELNLSRSPATPAG